MENIVVMPIDLYFWWLCLGFKNVHLWRLSWWTKCVIIKLVGHRAYFLQYSKAHGKCCVVVQHCFPSSSSTGLVLYRALGLPAQPQVSRASVCLLDPSPHNLQGVCPWVMLHKFKHRGVRDRGKWMSCLSERALKWSLGLRLHSFHWG